MSVSSNDSPMPDEQELLAKLAPHGQEHLLAFWDELAPGERASLARQIERIDFEQIAGLYRGELHEEDWHALAERAGPPPAVRIGADPRSAQHAAAVARGAAALEGSKVGVVLVAGGQGTRLGFDDPKGVYPIGPVSGAPLFKILFEKVRASARRHRANLPLYVMTSPATDAPTRQYLAEHDWFGLAEDDVRLFCQGTMPAVDARTGQVLLAERGRIFENPDGHGGMLAALADGGLLDEIEQRGLEQLFYMQVDNPLAPVCDPAFIGHHLIAGSELTTLVVAKGSPEDKLGNVVEIDGRVRIIEYSDLPPEHAARRDSEGSLTLWAGNTAVHVFDVAFLRRMARRENRPVFHRALKKVPYVAASGDPVEPAEPNAYKFEQFIFDLLPAARHALVVEGRREECFAPLKNASGAETDSPEAVRAQMIALHTDWLKKAGVEVAEGTPIEISPLFAVDAEEVARRIDSGLPIRSAAYFAPGQSAPADIQSK